MERDCSGILEPGIHAVQSNLDVGVLVALWAAPRCASRGGSTGKAASGYPRRYGTADIAPLLVRSEVNLEQALSAFRLTLVVNISIPLGLVVLINQLAPGAIANLFVETPAVAVLGPLAVMLALLITAMWYAYAGALAARDLNHLLRLRLADTDTGVPRGLTGAAEIDPTIDGL